jgi:hypothetical protein
MYIALQVLLMGKLRKKPIDSLCKAPALLDEVQLTVKFRKEQNFKSAVETACLEQRRNICEVGLVK